MTKNEVVLSYLVRGVSAVAMYHVFRFGATLVRAYVADTRAYIGLLRATPEELLAALDVPQGRR